VVLAFAAIVLALLVLLPVLAAAVGPAYRSLGRRSRWWGYLDIVLVLYAALGVSDLVRWARRRGKVPLAVTAALLIAATVPWPFVSSLTTPQAQSAPPPFLTGALLGDAGNLLAVLSRQGHRQCVVALPRPGQGSASVFSVTGYRQVMFNAGQAQLRSGNLSRIRWADIYQRIPSDDERQADDLALTSGTGGEAAWRALVRKYGVDLVVVPKPLLADPVFAGLPETDAGTSLAVVQVHACPGPG
jgi:hypothetical protein